jgi:adenylate cyclase
LEGSRRRVVVLFSDVRNFTTRTETSSPEAIVADLNRYFTEMVAVVHAHGGLVDKFIGDGMMAIFGFDGEQDAATAAVLAARDMHTAVSQLNQSLAEPIAIGIGIHVGEAIAGTIGSPDRMEFTFIGDVVNTAARIESMTKAMGVSPLISADVLGVLSPAARGLAWVDVGTQGLKGKQEAVQLWGLHVDGAATGTPPT